MPARTTDLTRPTDINIGNPDKDILQNDKSIAYEDPNTYTAAKSNTSSSTSDNTTLTKPSGMPTSDWEKAKTAGQGEAISEMVGKNTPDVIYGSTEKGKSISKLNTNNYDAANNVGYYDATNISKEAYSPNTEGKTGTGTGVAAAVGEGIKDYSWNTKAKDLAENAYQQKVTEEKSAMLSQRQQIEQDAQKYQTQADMQTYSDRQAADKVGWTGGYVLDQERQKEFMKQSIQAQLYGAMELQKYGYDTSMAAARLAYDANMMQYAQEYYQQAVQNSINEAQITGTYFSAEVKEMLGQYKAALANIESGTDVDRATKIKDTIKGWFQQNNISEEGIKTLEAWNTEQALEYQWSNELWTRYNAAIQSTKEDVEAANKFWILDSEGNVSYDGATAKVGDWNTMSDEDKLSYAISSNQAGSQLQGYLNQSILDAVNQYKQSKYNSETKTYEGLSAKDLSKIITEYTKSVTDGLKETANSIEDKTQKEQALKILNYFDGNYCDRIFKQTFPTRNVSEDYSDAYDIKVDYSGNTINVSQEKEEGEKKVQAEIAKINEEKKAIVNANGMEIETDMDAVSLNETADPISVTADAKAFNPKQDWNGITDKKDTQSVWINVLQRAAGAGLIPEGTMVCMNVGARWDNDDIYMYSSGYWYKLKAFGNDASQYENIGAYRVDGDMDEIKEAVQKITKRGDLVDNYLDYLKSNS